MSLTESITEQSNHTIKNSPTLLAKIKYILFNITVEPTVFLTMFTSIMYQLISQNLYLEKSCRVNIEFNTSVCDAMTNRHSSGYSKPQDILIQKLVSQMLVIRTVIQSLFPFCLILFVGSWTDRHRRRKPVILAPIIGEMICCICLILNVIFFSELPLIFTTLGDSLPLALLGGWPCFFVGIYTYIGEKCNKQSRTLRVGIVSASKVFACSFGLSAAGFIYSSIGFIGFYAICTLVLLFAFILAVLLVKEDKIQKSDQTDGFFRDFFDINYFINSLRVCFKRGPNNKRLKAIIILLLVFMVTGPMHGELNVTYLFTRLKFEWNSTQFGIFKSIMLSVEMTGSSIAVLFFSKYLGYDDTILGIVGLTGSVLGSLTYAMAPNEFVFYLGMLCDCTRMSTYIAMRSIMSKIVPPNELGQSNSVFGVCESLVPLLFGPLYIMIYKYTLDIFPGMFYILTISTKFIGLCFFIWLYTLAMKEKNGLRINSDITPKNHMVLETSKIIIDQHNNNKN